MSDDTNDKNNSEKFLYPEHGWQILGYLAHQLLIDESNKKGKDAPISNPVLRDALQAVADSFQKKSSLNVKLGIKRYHKRGTSGEVADQLGTLYMIVRDTFQAIQDGLISENQSALEYLETGLTLNQLTPYLTDQKNILKEQICFRDSDNESERLKTVVRYICTRRSLLIDSRGKQGPQIDALDTLHQLTGNKSQFNLALINSESEFWTTNIADGEIDQISRILVDTLKALDYSRNNDLDQIAFFATPKRHK